MILLGVRIINLNLQEVLYHVSPNPRFLQGKLQMRSIETELLALSLPITRTNSASNTIAIKTIAYPTTPNTVLSPT